LGSYISVQILLQGFNFPPIVCFEMQGDLTAEVTNPLTQKSLWYRLRTLNEVFQSSGGVTASYCDSLFNILQYLPATSQLRSHICVCQYSNVDF